MCILWHYYMHKQKTVSTRKTLTREMFCEIVVYLQNWFNCILRELFIQNSRVALDKKISQLIYHVSRFSEIHYMMTSLDHKNSTKHTFHIEKYYKTRNKDFLNVKNIHFKLEASAMQKEKTKGIPLKTE